MSEESDFEEAKKKAIERYEVDVGGVILNTLVSATSSVTAGALLNFVKSVPTDQMPLIIGIVFFAQVVPKLLVELNRAYAANQAKREGYSQGYIESSSLEDTRDGTRFKGFFDLCERASYF